MIADSNRFPDSTLKPACCFSGLSYGRITSASFILACLTFSPTVLPLIVRACAWMRPPAINSCSTAGTINGKTVGENVMADRFPVLDREHDADVARDGVDVDRCIAGA